MLLIALVIVLVALVLLMWGLVDDIGPPAGVCLVCQDFGYDEDETYCGSCGGPLT